MDFIELVHLARLYHKPLTFFEPLGSDSFSPSDRECSVPWRSLQPVDFHGSCEKGIPSLAELIHCALELRREPVTVLHRFLYSKSCIYK